MNNIIEMQNVEKHFGDKKVLKNIELTIQEGEIFGLLGPSGTGKTTIVNILTGQMPASGGIVRVLGEKVEGQSGNICDGIGIMMDQFGLYERLTVYDNLKMFAKIYGVTMERVDEVLKKIGLYEAKKVAVSNLSKGMRGRLRLARAVLKDVKILFLDEPTSGLDPSTTREIHGVLLEKCKQGTTIFLTTHNMMEAQTLCDKVALLNDGNIVEYGTPEELCRKYNHLNKIKVCLHNGEDMELPNAPSAADTIRMYLEKDEITAIHSTEPDLEQVFLELTGRRFE